MSNRRKFIQQTILGISGSALLPVIGHASSGPMTSMATANAPLQIGMAGYSFAKFSLDQSIAMMKRIGLSNMSLKEMHLPLNSTGCTN
jgi:hypothetical protein